MILTIRTRADLGNMLGGNDHQRALVCDMKWWPIGSEATIKGD
jgi:hypothetical protein